MVELPDLAGALADEADEDDEEDEADEAESEVLLDEEPGESLVDAASLLLLLDDDSEALDEESDELLDEDVASLAASPFFLFLAPLISARESFR